MGQSDWAVLEDSLAIASIKRGVTGGVTPPSGGGSFAFVFHSLSSEVAGASGLYLNQTNFTPTGSGSSVADGSTSIRGAVKRLASPGNTGFSPFLFACCQGGPPSVTDDAYMLGLGDSDPYEIILAKGPISSGLNPSDSNIQIIARSNAQYSMADGLWHHLKLDAIVQPNGDVKLQVFSNDLTVNPIGSTPIWEAVAGIDNDDTIDDALNINTGSAPLLGGYVGFAFASSYSLNRRGAFDAIEIGRMD